MVTIPVDPQLTLRQLQRDDAEELFAVTNENRDQLRTWLPWLDQTRVVAVTASFIEFTLRVTEAGTGLHCAVLEHGNIVGVCGYNRIEAVNRRSCIGYWLAASARGRGVMSRSVSALVNYGFTKRDLNRQIIACSTGNRESAAVAERCGFTFEGIAREAEWLYDHFVDHRIYSRLRSDAAKPFVMRSAGARAGGVRELSLAASPQRA